MENNKVFIIGFHKTGTSSVVEALKILGFKTIHGDPRSAEKHKGTEGKLLIEKYIKKNNYMLPTFTIYDAFADNPYFHIWYEIVKIYPDAKYILTIRDENKWINSCCNYYSNRRIRPMREWMFGEYANPSKNLESKNIWLNKYREHNKNIIDFFNENKKELLIFNVADGDGWDKLCNFLDKKKPDQKFPHKNKGKFSFFKEKINDFRIYLKSLLIK